MNDDTLIFQIIFIIVYGLSGLCAGSFASAIIYREKSNLPWFKLGGPSSRSACLLCGTTLGFRDLVPVISWLSTKGRCRHCTGAIPVFYPLIELLCAFCAIMVFLWSGISIVSVTFLFCLPFLVSIIYLGVFQRRFSFRLVIIVGAIGLLAFGLQLGFN